MEENKLLQGRNFHRMDLTGSNFGEVQNAVVISVALIWTAAASQM